jgi:signal transduction histidine kinase
VKLNATGNGDSIKFSVKDDGCGIAKDQIHKLFTKFQQLDSSDARLKGGTGLGLAISKEIVERHHGKIGIESEPGKGSLFWIELPAQTGVAEPHHPQVILMDMGMAIMDGIDATREIKRKLPETTSLC